MNNGKYAFLAPQALMRASISACMRSQMAYPQGRMTMVPRTGPFSASSALATTSWYQRGKSVAWGVRTGAFAIPSTLEGGRGPGCLVGGEHGVGPGQRPLGLFGNSTR